MGDRPDLVEAIVASSSKKKKLIVKSASFKIENNKYEPLRPYLLVNGWGGMYKKKTIEWIFLNKPIVFASMVNWIKRKNLSPDNPFRLHVSWLVNAFDSLPRIKCQNSSCKDESKFFSIRRSFDGQLTFSCEFVACETHAHELKEGEPNRIFIKPLLPNSVNIFKYSFEKESFLKFIKNCFFLKNLNSNDFFVLLKRFFTEEMIIETEKEKKKSPQYNLFV